MSAKPTDPVLDAVANARVGEPETDEERRAVEEARASLARGERTYSQDEVEAMLEQWRELGRAPTKDELHAMLEKRRLRARG